MNAACFDSAVTAHCALAEGIRLLTARWEGPAPHAGQFFTLRAWGSEEGPFLSRPISVHKWDAEKHEIEFLYQVKGTGTQKLAALRPGDTLQLTGPMGNGFDAAALAAQYPRIAVVGGGIGTAPLYQLVRELAAAGNKPAVFFGFADLPYATAEYTGLAAKLELATDSGKAGLHGFVTQLYRPEDYDVILLCGPSGMMKAAAKAAMAAGTACFASLEAKMACGIGACLGCTCKTNSGEGKSVCKHGPVFDAKEVF